VTAGAAGSEDLSRKHAIGLFTWTDWWLRQSGNIPEHKQTRPEFRYEQIAIQARRELWAQHRHRLYSYLDAAADFTNTAGVQDFDSLWVLLSEDDVRNFGFTSHGEMASFAAEFRRLLESKGYGLYLERELQAGVNEITDLTMSHLTPEMRAKVKGTDDLAKPMRMAMFDFLYFNYLFPPGLNDESGTDTRKAALAMLGLPANTKYASLADQAQLQGLDGVAIGRHFSNWNATYVRTEKQRQLLYQTPEA
jgi:hypothetical protein